jgi:hypothetical protein
MERFIPMVEDSPLRDRLTHAIDGKGAFRRFKDVLMSHGPERERWFAFRSERLRVFMEAWLSAHALRAVVRPNWPTETVNVQETPISQDQLSGRRSRGADALRKQIRELTDLLGSRDLEKVLAFAEFVKARRAARSYAHRHDGTAEGGDDGLTAEDAAPDTEEPVSDDDAQSEKVPKNSTVR